jgi:hypothetical protein
LGCALASATYSFSVAACTPGCTTITSGVVYRRVTGTSLSFSTQHASGASASLMALLTTAWYSV